MIEHFTEHIGEQKTKAIAATVAAEIENSFYYFEAIYCLVNDGNMRTLAKLQSVFASLGIASRVIPVYLSRYSNDADVARAVADLKQAEWTVLYLEKQQGVARMNGDQVLLRLDKADVAEAS